MFVVNSYSLAVFFCVVTMLCWGSWGNTQKLASKTWRYEYFYWDYVIGVLLFSILSALTLGSIGDEGRSFLSDLRQADWVNIGSAFGGGIIFNASNILLSAAISVCGMSVYDSDADPDADFPDRHGLWKYTGIHYRGTDSTDFLSF